MCVHETSKTRGSTCTSRYWLFLQQVVDKLLSFGSFSFPPKNLHTLFAFLTLSTSPSTNPCSSAQQYTVVRYRVLLLQQNTSSTKRERRTWFMMPSSCFTRSALMLKFSHEQEPCERVQQQQQQYTQQQINGEHAYALLLLL